MKLKESHNLVLGAERLYVIPYVTALFNQLAEPRMAHSNYILFIAWV